MSAGKTEKDREPLPSRTSSASMIWFRFNGFFSASGGKHPSEIVDQLIAQDAMQNQASPSRFPGARLPLVFDGLLLIVGGGEVDVSLLGRLHGRGAGLVAADGGAGACAEAGIVPDAIIGDMDSLENREEWEAKCPVFPIVEQESTDFEKCLCSTRAARTLALGMTGKRLDHTLAALDVLAKYSGQRKLALLGSRDLVLSVRGACSFRCAPGARVSVHPLQAIRFARSSGLEYSLEGVELAPGKKSGTSNRATSGFVEIFPEPNENSPYLVFMDGKYLDFWLQGEFI